MLKSVVLGGKKPEIFTSLMVPSLDSKTSDYSSKTSLHPEPVPPSMLSAQQVLSVMCNHGSLTLYTFGKKREAEIMVSCFA